MALRAVICGAGQVGTHIAAILSQADHHVTVIDLNADRIAVLADSMDISTLPGTCASGEILIEAGVAKADLVVACTNQDEVNLLTATIAKSLGAKCSVARVEHRVFLESGGLDYAKALGIDGMICPDYSTAQAIARVVRNPDALSIEDFGLDSIEMQEFEVVAGSPGLGRQLQELPMPPRTLVAALARGESSIIPTGEDRVEPGDRVVLVGDSAVFQQARLLFDAGELRHQQVVIKSGSPMAVWLCRALCHRRVSIRLFEPDRARAAELSNKLDWVTVIQDDVVDPEVFEEEKVCRCDFFVACGVDDEENILSCVWAKNKGARNVIAVSGRSDYLDLLRQIGIDFAFSPRNEAADEIESYLVKAPLRKMASLSHDRIDVYRVPVGANSRHIGKMIAELGRPEDWIIAAVRREDTCFVPTADDTIESGDILVIIGSHDQERQLAKLFNAAAE